MELAMTNGISAVGFTELNEKEMMWFDGGIDWGGVGSGLFDMVGGIVEGVIGGLTIVKEPSYIMKAGGVYAIFDGEDRFSAGYNEFVNALKQ